jgi:hypothetical protein
MKRGVALSGTTISDPAGRKTSNKRLQMQQIKRRGRLSLVRISRFIAPRSSRACMR